MGGPFLAFLSAVLTLCNRPTLFGNKDEFAICDKWRQSANWSVSGATKPQRQDLPVCVHPLTRWPLRHDWHAHLVPSGRTTILGLRDYVKAACLRDLRDLQTERLGGAASLEIEGCENMFWC